MRETGRCFICHLSFKKDSNLSETKPRSSSGYGLSIRMYLYRSTIWDVVFMLIILQYMSGSYCHEIQWIFEIWDSCCISNLDLNECRCSAGIQIVAIFRQMMFNITTVCISVLCWIARGERTYFAWLQIIIERGTKHKKLSGNTGTELTMSQNSDACQEFQKSYQKLICEHEK